MEGHLKKLHKAIEAMAVHRKELASTSTNLSNSIAMLGEHSVQAEYSNSSYEKLYIYNS